MSVIWDFLILGFLGVVLDLGLWRLRKVGDVIPWHGRQERC